MKSFLTQLKDKIQEARRCYFINPPKDEKHTPMFADGYIQDALIMIENKQKEPFELYIKNIKDEKTYKVWKYLNNGEEISIWCHGWYGRHVIGQDCEFI